MELQTTFLDAQMPHPAMNGGGVCRTMEDVQKFARSEVAIVNVSIVYDERAGNSGDVYHRTPHYSINALGLPSRGIGYYREVLADMVRTAHTAGKKLMANISAFTPEQYAELYQLCCEAGVDFVEFNFGCPNVKDGGVRKPIFSFYPGLMTETLMLSGAIGEGSKAGIKFSPMTNPVQRDDMCSILTEWASKRYVLRVWFATLCNTFPDTLDFKSDGQLAITIVLGGMGGPAMKPAAMAHIYQFKQNQKSGDLPDYVELVGSGGVESGQDVLDFRRVGSTMVQATTASTDRDEDPEVYGDIAADYAELLENPATVTDLLY